MIKQTRGRKGTGRGPGRPRLPPKRSHEELRTDMGGEVGDRMITKEEVMALAHCGPKLLKTMVRAGKLPKPTPLGDHTLRWWLAQVLAALRRLEGGKGKGSALLAEKVSPLTAR